VIEQDDALVLGVQNNFYQSWLEENYLPLIEDALAAVHGQRLKIAFSVLRESARPAVPASSEPAPAPLVREKPAAPPPRQQLNPKYSFDTFINSFAHAASLAVAQSPARAYNPLFIYGGVGLGKTHLMQAIGTMCRPNRATGLLPVLRDLHQRVHRRAAEEGAGAVPQEVPHGGPAADRRHAVPGRQGAHAGGVLPHLQRAVRRHKQIVMTCDRPASEIPGLEHRLVSRFEWGLVTELEQPDVETRIAILRKKRDELNLQVPTRSSTSWPNASAPTSAAWKAP
jgi:chromosomal replication initiator protein